MDTKTEMDPDEFVDPATLTSQQRMAAWDRIQTEDPQLAAELTSKELNEFRARFDARAMIPKRYLE